MTLDQSQRAARIVDDERARRPRWLGATNRTPSWFSGEELDLLEPAERGKLYREQRARHQAVEWFPLIVALSSLANVIQGLRSEHARLVWFAAAAGLVLVAVGAWLHRRQDIARAGRRHVRESADWPLRRQDRVASGSA